VTFKQLVLCGFLVVPSLGGAIKPADAQLIVPGASFSISCDNGGNYLLESGPVAAPGEIVTARLYLRPRHGIPVRLFPMGDGYRYAGRGVWLDGIRERALLYLSKYQPTACIVGRI
jgi:hypothetical protein